MIKKILSDNPRLLLARLREGDYAHAGETEAIDLVINGVKDKLPVNQKIRILDAGCGLGGTAAYIQKDIPSEIIGIDIDTAAIEHAKKTYPDIYFDICNILDVTKLDTKFNFIYLFNVFYAIPNQLAALKALHHVAKPGAVLAIFDYVALAANTIQMKDLSGKAMNFVTVDKLTSQLTTTGWNILEIVNLNKEYQVWYQRFLDKLAQYKPTLLEDFTEESFDKVLTTFSQLLYEIKKGSIGGILIYSHRKALF